MKVTLEAIRGLIKEVLEEQGGLGPTVARTGHQVGTAAKASGRGSKWKQIGSVEAPGSGITGTEQYGEPTRSGRWSGEDTMTVARALCDAGLSLNNADALQRTAGGTGVSVEDFLESLTTGGSGAPARLMARAKRKGWVTDLPPEVDCSILDS